MKFIVIGITDNPNPYFPPEVMAIIRDGKVFSGGKRHHEIVAPLLPADAEWIDITVPLDTVFEQYGLKPEINQGDEWLISDISSHFKDMVGVPLKRQYPDVGHYFTPDEAVKFGTHTFTILPTPGHTPGGVSYYCAEEKVLFSGDTLFRMSVGRTDFDKGSYTDLITSLKSVLGILPPDTTVYCGHGPITTIGDELKYNPYLHA